MHKEFGVQPLRATGVRPPKHTSMPIVISFTVITDLEEVVQRYRANNRAS